MARRRRHRLASQPETFDVERYGISHLGFALFERGARSSDAR
jgi:hypothetical protein